MYKTFLEIAFEAELCTDEGPELLEAAREHCDEDPLTRPTVIAELRDLIFERGECSPFRTDDEFLLRFLRVRGFIPARAYRLLVRYCAFREQYRSLHEGVDLWGLVKVKDAYEGVMYDRPDHGRISVFRFGTWDPCEFPVEDLVRAGMVMCEIGIRQPKVQVLGGTVIVDLEGITLRHVATLTPTVAYQIVCLMGVYAEMEFRKVTPESINYFLGTEFHVSRTNRLGCALVYQLAYPTRLRSCHIINYSWILNTFFFIFKRFIPQKAWSTIFFHGYDLKSLQSHIDQECLPPRYGGTCRNLVSFGTWLKKVKKYRDEGFDKEMKVLGYVIKE